MTSIDAKIDQLDSKLREQLLKVDPHYRAFLDLDDPDLAESIEYFVPKPPLQQTERTIRLTLPASGERARQLRELTTLCNQELFGINGETYSPHIIARERSGIILGGLWYSHEGSSVHVEQLYVQEEYRGEKYGTRLMHTLFDNVSAQKVTLDAPWSVIPFYKKLGFNIVSSHNASTLAHLERRLR